VDPVEKLARYLRRHSEDAKRDDWAGTRSATVIHGAGRHKTIINTFMEQARRMIALGANPDLIPEDEAD
jgi:hypothetical protein